MAHHDEFEDRVAIVTGGASGIGAASVELFSELGARVVSLDLHADPRLDCDRIKHVVVDVGDDAAIDEVCASIADRWGRIDHLVNCAASFVAAGREATRDQWERSLGVNVASSAMLSAKVAERMPPGSTIVNVSSISAHVAQPDRWTYNASKAAILALTRGQAFDLRHAGIRVNAVSPGWVWTQEVARAAGGDRARWEPVWGRYHLLERLGEPHEVAEAVVFLSSERSSFVNGAELLVDGGYSAMGPEGLGESAVFAGTDHRSRSPIR